MGELSFKPAGDPCACFVGNISWTTTGEDLLGYFSGAGHVTSTEVMAHADTGRSKGWALVKFNSAREADQAVQQFDQQEFHDRQLSVRRDRAGFESAGGTVVFVGNLPWSANDDTLGAMLSPYGPTDSTIKTTASGKSRGFALVRFPSADVAARFVEGHHQSELDGRVLEVREDKPPDDLRAKGHAAEASGASSNSGGPDTARGKGRGARGGDKGRGGGRGGGGGGSGGGGGVDGGGGGDGGQGHDSGSKSGSTARVHPGNDAPSLSLFVNNLNWNSTDDDLFQHFMACGATPISAKVGVFRVHEHRVSA